MENSESGSVLRLRWETVLPLPPPPPPITPLLIPFLRCQLALKMNGWEEEKAIEWIFNPNNFASLNLMTREFDAKGRAAKKSKKKKSASTKGAHKNKQLKTGGKWNGTQNFSHKRKHPSNERTKNLPKRRKVIEIEISSEEEGEEGEDEEEDEEEGEEAETAEGKEEEDMEDKGENSSGEEERDEEEDKEEAFNEEKADTLAKHLRRRRRRALPGRSKR